MGNGFRDLSFFQDAPFVAMAHRGDARSHAENTLGAFEAAVGLGYRFLETDVRLTRDGVLVVFHDATLARLADDRRAVGQLTFGELAQLELSGGGTIPRLETVLSAWPELRWNLDPKEDEVVEPLADLLQKMGMVDRICVGSHYDHRTNRLRTLLGDRLCTALGRVGAARLRLASWGLPLKENHASCAQIPVQHGPLPLVDRKLIECAHGQGIAVIVWTINDTDTMRQLIDLGVDGIMTDHASALRRVLIERALW
jgi:glycerophosphoryl diester phosphodiesterase